MLFQFRLHPAFDAISFFLLHLFQFISSLVLVLSWALYFSPALVLPVSFLSGLVIIVSKSFFLSRVFVQPFMQRYINKACTHLGIPRRQRKSLPFALIAGFTLGTVLCLIVLVYNAGDVLDLMEFVQEGRPERDPHFQSYFCHERGSNGKKIRAHGWSYLLWWYYDDCHRVDGIFELIRHEIEGMTVSKACNHLAWGDRATCASKFIKDGFIERLLASYKVTTLSIVHQFNTLRTCCLATGNWVLRNAFVVVAYSILLAIFKVALDTYSDSESERRLVVLKQLYQQLSQKDISPETYRIIAQRYGQLEMQMQTAAQTPKWRTNKQKGWILPTIVVTAATPIVKQLASPFRRVVAFNPSPDMSWDTDSEDDYISDEADGAATTSSWSVSSIIAGLLSALGLGKNGNLNAPGSEGMGMTSSFSSMCLSDLTKGATQAEAKLLAGIESDITVSGIKENGSRTLEWLVFLMGFLSAFYATAMAFLAPVIVSFLPSFATYFPVIYAVPNISFSHVFPSVYDTANFRYRLLARWSLLLHFVRHGDASAYRESEYWECTDWWGNVVKVFAPMAEATKAGFVKCLHVKPRANEYIEMCDVNGPMARARCIIRNMMKDAFAKPLNVNTIFADKIRSIAVWVVQTLAIVIRTALKNKHLLVGIILLLILSHMIPKIDENAEIQYQRELILNRSLQARQERLLNDISRLRERAHKRQIKLRPIIEDDTPTSNPIVPSRRTYTGQMVGLGLGLGLRLETTNGVGSELRLVQAADRVMLPMKSRPIAREIEGREMLAKWRAAERAKEACESDSDTDSDATVEAVTPTDAVIMSGTAKDVLDDVDDV